MNDQEIFSHPDFPGMRFRVHIEPDSDADSPWTSEDGHGPMRFVRDRDDKRPGERVMTSHSNAYWLYDWQAACKLARKDGWNTEPYDAPDRITRAVQADFDRMKGWINDDWWYIGVCVEVIDEDDEPLTQKYEHALWRIESDNPDYHKEVALELAAAAAEEIAEKQDKIKAGQAEREALYADAERWRKFCRIAQRKDLGTEFDEHGRPHSPMFRRWFIDAKDLTAESPSAALDSLKEPTV
jgi:hypothetical protein